ncbi:MAG: nucleotidyltransferase domain-containing protein [Blastocatellia bacterium]|nr:nucleotidyltransferase domain-containing protein [Blastocatellia bacterium]MBL8194462.1 nucleotidyltransferase domain-containing protein [Blastocatellia bacterium]MBN8722851.1 nucleotidyltransferase domain-containing protein [Acidobacteriota bacterium]
MSTVRKLKESGLISPPSFVPHNIHYETIMGSVAYGVSSDTSDMDVYGFCVPPKDMIFPHLAGEILGFGQQINRFEQYQQHHILDKSALAGAGRTYDITIYSIVKYFQLCMENNPNMIDSLFTPANCVLHITKLGNMVRENRKIFLHKGAWHKFKGYAYSQLHKMTTKDPIGQRKKIIESYGYDVKFAYHVVRLLNEVEQILIEGDIDLQRNREQLKSIRRGEWKESDIRDYFASKEKDLEKLYLESSLPYSPDEAKIKKLLLECLEEHYGNLSDAIITPDKATIALQEIQNILDKVKDLL